MAEDQNKDDIDYTRLYVESENAAFRIPIADQLRVFKADRKIKAFARQRARIKAKKAEIAKQWTEKIHLVDAKIRCRRDTIMRGLEKIKKREATRNAFFGLARRKFEVEARAEARKIVKERLKNEASARWDLLERENQSEGTVPDVLHLEKEQVGSGGDGGGSGS